MDNIKDDLFYIKKAIENIDAIQKYTKNVSYSRFVEDDLLVDATLFRLVQMAENINHISKTYRENHKTIKWGSIIGFRNGVVHDYGKADYNIIYEIISKDIYDLKKALQEDL